MSKVITEKIKIWGTVQGVGFRPFVAKTAKAMEMKGQVLNTGGLVEISLTDTKERISIFLDTLISNKPTPAEIVHIKREIVNELNTQNFEDFTIAKSQQGQDEVAMIPADMAICEDCYAEVKNPNNRRHNHPLNSCMVCGARYTIVNSLPYDRENTTMEKFEMCQECQGEYTGQEERRYHAQTISCHNCGPCLILLDREDKIIGNTQAKAIKIIQRGAESLKNGDVIGFKSMGGYNLVCDAQNVKAIQKLRELKGREEKPFAIMYENADQIRKICKVSLEEAALLESSARPIVLLRQKGATAHLGVFLPSMAAQYMLLEEVGGPLIFTSGNVSGQPIMTEDKEFAQWVQKQKDLISMTIYNERKIVSAVDDSVVRVIDNQPQIVRRSKGYAPAPLFLAGNTGKTIFAAGGDLKSSFGIQKENFVYLSQFFGDTYERGIQNQYNKTKANMENIFRITPDVIVTDKHPMYFTTKLGEKLSDEKKIPLIKVQHHHAHVASVMAEHGLEEKVIGVAFDGTGYGTDGKIWGGEVLICHKGSFERFSHLKYANIMGGDSSMREAWKSALTYRGKQEKGNKEEALKLNQFTIDISNILEYAKVNKTIEKFVDSKTVELVEKAIKEKINVVESSSVGRLFDAVSSLLGVCHYNQYEGQCAIMLEDKSFEPKDRAGELALEFHKNVSKAILTQCQNIREKYGIDKVALSGGVFQNQVLMEETLKILRAENFIVYYNISVSPNDGGIALGQAYIGHYKADQENLTI